MCICVSACVYVHKRVGVRGGRLEEGHQIRGN